MRLLQQEKRQIQMEFMNRETNFNRMFNSQPQVGILNPLAIKVSNIAVCLLI